MQAPEKQSTAVEEDENASNAQSSTSASNKEEIFHPPVFVNTLRGKRTGGKRKISEAVMANECDGPGSAEVRSNFLWKVFCLPSLQRLLEGMKTWLFFF